MRVYLFDLDGTLADCAHRMHHREAGNWDTFHLACIDDKPIPHMIALLDAIASEYPVIYVTGRNEICREQTVDWMEKHDLPPGQLYMRPAKCYAASHDVKAVLLDKLKADGIEIIMAFDDRSQDVNMYRKRGIPCAQVAEGNY